MKKTIIAMAIMALSGSAFAWGTTKNYGGDGGTGVGIAGAAAGAVAGAHAGASANVGLKNYNTNTAVGFGGNAHQRQGQGQLQGQMQGQVQGNRQRSNQNMTYNEAKQDYSDTYEDYVAPAYAPSIQPSAPCAIPISAGATVPAVIGLSGGTAYIEEGCVMRETVRIGLSGNAESQAMANAVIQSELQGYLDQADEVAREEIKQAEAGSSYESAMELLNL